LRRASSRDASDLHDVFSNLDAMACWSTPPHRNLAEIDAWIAATILIGPHKGGDFVVECDGPVISKAGL
jgi:[ribosomal protein S5]-alanine N-acetyltransferase